MCPHGGGGGHCAKQYRQSAFSKQGDSFYLEIIRPAPRKEPPDRSGSQVRPIKWEEWFLASWVQICRSLLITPGRDGEFCKAEATP